MRRGFSLARTLLVSGAALATCIGYGAWLERSFRAAGQNSTHAVR